ncbi:guanylate kinase [Prochlorococcus sp. MIT 1223]|uniref:guanylate kinase n=1 Tax=Prochlorococcus sp. MIT 1223 TaxID=3096217 RepID=UPI002A755E3D|nr:guanylate kinase [Prochlorococcus sp. MIT 1223]
MNSFSKLTLITGPSGVGKGTLVKKLLERNKDLCLSVSATTRLPREGERDGKDYYFLEREEFKALIQENGFLEWAEFAGNLYGTPIEQLRQKLEKGLKVLLEIELEGARQVRARCPEALQIFISPPSFNDLEKRIRGRGTETEDSIKKRLLRANEELKAKVEFDAEVLNDDINVAVIKLEKLIKFR